MQALPRAASLQTCATLQAAIDALDVEALIHDITGPHTGHELLQIVITRDRRRREQAPVAIVGRPPAAVAGGWAAPAGRVGEPA